MVTWFSFPNLVLSRAIKKIQDYWSGGEPQNLPQPDKFIILSIYMYPPTKTLTSYMGRTQCSPCVEITWIFACSLLVSFKTCPRICFKKQMVRSNSSWRCCSSLGNILLIEVNQTENPAGLRMRKCGTFFQSVIKELIRESLHFCVIWVETMKASNQILG